MAFEEREIDGIKFTIQAIGVRKAFLMSRDIMELFLAPISLGVGAVVKDGKGLDMNADALLRVVGSDALPRLFGGLDRLKLDSLTKDLFAPVIAVVDGNKYELREEASFETVFRGRVLTVYKLLAHCIRFNFSDFFPDSLGAVVGKLAEDVKTGKILRYSEGSRKTSSAPGPAGASS